MSPTFEEIKAEQDQIIAEQMSKCNKWTSSEPECPYCGEDLDEALDIASEMEMELRREGDDGDSDEEEEYIICEKCGKRVLIKVQSEIEINFNTEYMVTPADEDDEETEKTVSDANFVESKEQKRLWLF